MARFFDTAVAVEIVGNSSWTHGKREVALMRLDEFLRWDKYAWLSDDDLGEFTDKLTPHEINDTLTLDVFFDLLGDYDLSWNGGSGKIVRWSDAWELDEDDNVLFTEDVLAAQK